MNYVFPGALIMLKSAEVRYVISENSAVYRKLLEVRLQQSADYRRGAQIGKTFIIRYVGQQFFENYIELNFAEDYNGPRLFEQVRTVKDFYFQVSTIAGERMGEKKNTLIFLDEIQAYPHLLTMLKFLKQDDRFTYIASGSLLGVTLKKTTSIPIGSIEVKRMFPLDFEEFLLANGFNQFAIDMMHEKFLAGESWMQLCTGR